MALKIAPKNSQFLFRNENHFNHHSFFDHNFAHEFRKSRGEYLRVSQAEIPKTERNYNYIEYLRKGYESDEKDYEKLLFLRQEEASRDFYTSKITEIRNLVQFDQKPSDLREARWDIYKISLSFAVKCKKIYKRSRFTLNFH